MARFRFMCHATFMEPSGPLGLLVWTDQAIAYFPVHNEDRGAHIAQLVRQTRDIAGLVEYLEDRGGGGYQ